MSEIVEGIKTEIEELVDLGSEVKQEIEDYRDEALAIDEDYRARNEHRNYIPLDDLPYGEEILRTERLPAEIDEAIDRIESINLDKNSVTEVVEILQEVRRVIEDAKSTVDDCTDLPLSSEPEENVFDEDDEDEDEKN